MLCILRIKIPVRRVLFSMNNIAQDEVRIKRTPSENLVGFRPEMFENYNEKG